MTCKDCVHYNVCIQEKECVEMLSYQVRTDVEKICIFFKDKSRFVEKTCDLGERFYFVVRAFNEICECTVVKIEMNYFTSPQEWLTVEYFSDVIGKQEYKNRIDLMLGKTVFLTREEAEKALKERNKK